MATTHRLVITNTRRIVFWSIAAVLIILTFVVAWISIRALMARDELMEAVPLVGRIGDQALDGGGIAQGDLEELAARTGSARSLTSDPVWRAVEWVPMLGSNLVAFRQAASMIDQLTEDVLPPLDEIASTFSADSLSPRGGVVDVSIFVKAQPGISSALTALENADARASSIDTENTIPQIGIAVDQVKELVSTARGAVQSVDTAVTLLPSMLGVNGPREYLLMSLNNAELRATGGIAGALAVVKAENGRIELGTLTNATALGEFEAPVLDLTAGEQVLYGDLLATYMQDINFTPNFARSGELAQAMWFERTGVMVDGVIAVDPVALGYILRATGPVEVGSGMTLTSDNATDFLLSGVYSSFPLPAEQDAFFARAMSQIFGTLVSGEADGVELLDALGEAASEDRLHLWSGDADEQSKILTTPLAGAVPISTGDTTAFGVYFNDATGGKMDYYLSSSIGVASAVCRNDGRPNFEIKVRLESRVPSDAASSLPRYVTADGVYGVNPGDISTNVFVYAPEGSVPYSVTIDGQEYAYVAAQEGSHSVAGVTIDLTPGQQSEISMKFVGLAGASAAVDLQHTPMATEVLTSLDNYLDCDSVEPAPIEGEEEQSGALSIEGFVMADQLDVVG